MRHLVTAKLSAARPSTLAKRLNLVLMVNREVRLIAVALGGAAHPAVETLSQAQIRSAARPSLRHHCLACRRLGFSPASLSLCRATLLSSASRPRFRRLLSAVRLGAMLARGVPRDYRAGRRGSLRARPAQRRATPGRAPQPREGPRPRRRPRPHANYEGAKGQK